MSDQTPIETLTERIEKARAYMNGWLADEPDGSPEKAKVGRYVADLLNELDAHVEAQRPGKVLTFPDGCEVTPDQLVHAARKAIEQMQFDVRPTREWGREAREAIDAFNGVVSMFERQVKLAPAQPLSVDDTKELVQVIAKALSDHDAQEWRSPPISYNAERDKLLHKRLFQFLKTRNATPKDGASSDTRKD